MNDEKYKTIIMIMIFMTVLPLTLMFGVSPLTVLHIYPIVLRRINIKGVKVYKPYYSGTVGVVSVNPKKESHYKKPLHMKPLIFTSVLICIGFLIIHVLSVIAFIQYVTGFGKPFQITQQLKFILLLNIIATLKYYPDTVLI